MKSILAIALVVVGSLNVVLADPLPEGWKHQDIGPAKTPGKTEQVKGAFAIEGTMDLWGVADGCQFAWQALKGDGEIVARVIAIDNPGGVAHAKASLCIREAIEPGARQVTVCTTPTDGTQFLYREKADAKTTRFLADPQNPKAPPKDALPKATFPIWLKLVRHGADITGYESADGTKWILTGQVKLELPADVLIGIAASSHKPDVLTRVTFDHVQVAPSAPPAKP